MQEKVIEKGNHSYKFLFKEISKIALPISFQALLSTMVQLIDSLFIGRLEDSTYLGAGLNAVNNVTFIISTIVGGVIAGIGVYFAQASGKGDKSFQKQLFISKMFWMVIWGSLCIAITVSFLSPISKLWIASGENQEKAIQAAKDYGSIIFPSMAFQFVLLVFSTSFKEMKLTKVAMLVAISGIITNASLNYPFIYVLGLGIKGSAYTTLISRAVEVSIWLIYVFRTKPEFLPRLHDFLTIRFKQLWQVFPKSMLWMINSLAITMYFTIQIMFMSRKSLDAGAALVAAGVVAQLVRSFVGGYIEAMNILIMHKLAKKSISIKELTHKYIVISTIAGIIMGIILMGISWSVFVIYPTYEQHTKWQCIWMIFAIGSMLWSDLTIGVYTSIFKSSGLTKSLLLMDGLYSWSVQFTVTLCLIYLVPSMDVGFIYWIVIVSNIFKPIIMRVYFHKKRASFKTLINNEKIEVNVI